MNIFFNIGGRYETAGVTGATHFLEHMMFKGSKNFGPGIFDGEIEKNGGNTNAYTTNDQTVYYQNLPSHFLEKIMAMEADRLQNLEILPTSFDSEKLVIFEERKMRYENSPEGQLYLTTLKEIFEKTPYGGSVIGEVSDLKALTRENLYDFYRKYYCPNNAIIVLSGDVKFSEVKKIAEKYFANIPASEEVEKLHLDRNRPELYTSRARLGREIKMKGTSKLPMFMLVYPGIELGPRKAYVLDVLSSIIGGGASSYLNQNYVDTPKPLLNSVSASNMTFQKSGVFLISGTAKSLGSFEGLKKKFFGDVKNLCDLGLTERNLQKTKNQLLLDHYRQIASNAGMASFLGIRESLMGDYLAYKTEFATYQSIELAELKTACHELFKPRGHILLSLWEGYAK
jgi:zinc protease